MRKNCLVLGILLMMVWVAGCGALYGKKSQYDEGDWYLFAGSSEVARIEQDKLAFNKLKEAPVNGDTIKGYGGIVTNLDKRYLYNFIISGPEQRGYALGGKYNTVTDYLIPGTYT
ncbi:hypothetical protein KAU19_01515 [Candidatus Parcubacteria bacterium]|nr:hypothetical protein [Candidatus Parcubacteria bacterium]